MSPSLLDRFVYHATEVYTQGVTKLKHMEMCTYAEALSDQPETGLRCK